MSTQLGDATRAGADGASGRGLPFHARSGPGDGSAAEILTRQEIALRADVGSAVAHGKQLADTLRGCTEAIVAHLDAAFARVWVLDARGEALLLRASSGLYTHLDGAHARVPVGAFKIGKIASSRQPHCSNDVLRDPLVDGAWAAREGLVSFAGYPLVHDGRLLGVVALFARRPLPDETLDLLASIVDLIAVGIERERGAAALRTSEARYRSLAAASSQVVWTADASGAIHEESPTWCTFTGQSAEQWTNGRARDAIHPDDAARVAAEWQTAIDAGRPFSLEYRLRRADGRYAAVVSRGVPILDDDGRVAEWVGAIDDVSDQRRAEAAHRLERERLRQVLEHVPASISVSRGPDHVIESMNAMSRRVLSGRDLTGLKARDALPEIEGQGYFEILDRVFSTGEPFFATEAPVRFDRTGTGRMEVGHFNVAYLPLLDVEGRVDGILSCSVDVTDLVQARERVQRGLDEVTKINAELDQFAYVASHDLKAPLRGISNLAQWIEEDLGDAATDEIKSNMALLRGRVRRLEALIDGILAYSRAGRARDKVEPVDVGAIAREVTELLAPAPPARIVVDGELPVVSAERVKLQQVLMNLAANALKHARRADVTVTIGVDEGPAGGAPPGMWSFRVADDGVGIPAEYAERIWGIFQTLEARDSVESTGIGLSVVRKIVETQGGRAWVDQTRGPGATLRFTWPK